MELQLMWIYRAVGSDERAVACAAHEAGKLLTNWNCPENFRRKLCKQPPMERTPKEWARSVGWPTPFFAFDKTFLATMLSDDAHYRLAMDRGGVELFVPVERYVVPDKDVKKWHRENKDPENWDALAAEFQLLCRIMNYGVPVVVEDHAYSNSSTFYSQFVCKHFRNLEDGADIFILDP